MDCSRNLEIFFKTVVGVAKAAVHRFQLRFLETEDVAAPERNVAPGHRVVDPL